MNEENLFTKTVSIAIVIVICSFSSCTAYINHDDNKAMKEMVKNGSNAIDARCAVKGSRSGVCAIRAASKKD